MKEGENLWRKKKIKGSTFCKLWAEILMGLGVCFLSIAEFCYNPVWIIFFLPTDCCNKNVFLWNIAKIISMRLFSSIVPLAFPNGRIPIP